MTRQEIETTYKVENGIIHSPGKFEGCPVYAPYFYDLMLHGAGDTFADTDEAEGAARIAVDADDIAQFPELANEPFIEVWEDNNGFVHVR